MPVILRTILLAIFFLMPAVSAFAQSACNAAREGVILYNTDHKLVQFCNGQNWIGLAAKIGGAGDTLSDLSCANGEIVKWNGTAWACAQDSGGLAALQGSDDPGACTLAKDGLIRYRTSGNPKWEYCDGGTTSWLPFRLPQCQNDGTGECTLSALRSSDDPQFAASGIRCGNNILGVVGTYGSGSSSAFTFADVTNAALSTLTTASAVTISGIPAGCPGEVSVAGDGTPEISINGGGWVTSGAIANGQTLAVRLTSSASFSTAHTATVSIGSTVDDWVVTTLAADTTPNAFDFAPNVTNAAVSTLTTASNVTITGINAPTPVSVTGAGAQISINGGAWGTSGTITNGQTLGLRLTSSASFSTAIVATVDVGGVTDTWSVTTVAADTTPNAFDFTPNVTNAALSTLTTASAVTITGINTTTPVSVSGTGSPQISINGGAWVTSGTITNGQTLAVRLTSSPSFNTILTATVDVGGVTDAWSVTTLLEDTTPDAFNFTPNVTNAALNTLTTAANTVTISGINSPASVSVSGGGSPQVRINGGSWVTSGTISNGETLQLRLTSSGSYNTGLTATVNVGGVTDNWSVTTRPNVTPGSQLYASPGTYSFTIPAYNSLTVEVWGAGAGGSGITASSCTKVAGTDGGNSSWGGSTIVAQGGNKGSGNSGGTGGTASGGSTNTTGQAGTSAGKGGNGANGGAGGASRGSAGNGNAGSAPAGGGGGAYATTRGCYEVDGPGGGGGAYATRTYAPGAYAIGQSVSVVVGTRGTGGNGATYDGGLGAHGRVEITWN